MKPIDGQQQNDFEQILDDRHKRKALIISSQLPISDWHAIFRKELIADACMDRISHKSIRFQLLGESLRKNINVNYHSNVPFIFRTLELQIIYFFLIIFTLGRFRL